jgi:hypothetical protein
MTPRWSPLISRAHSLKVRCGAEGVETVGQLQLLEQPGCDVAQGYLFSSPVDDQTPGSTSTCRQRRTELHRHPGSQRLSSRTRELEPHRLAQGLVGDPPAGRE